MRVCVSLFLIILTTTVSAYCDAAEIVAQTESAPAMAATISGRLLTPGKKPLTTGIVLLYDKSLGPPPSPGKYWRIPDIITGTDNKGNFSIEIPEGTYFLQAAQKKPDGEIGPPKEREFFYFHRNSKGKPRPLIVTPGSKMNLGALVSYVWTPDMSQRDKGITAVEGIVTDLAGKPVQGCLVFAHLTENVQERATFVSERTDNNGKFLLRVLEGTYYLKVRSVIGGGAPKEGEYLNSTSEFTPTKVTLATGQKLQDITLKVKKFSRPGSAQRPAGVVNVEKTWKNLGNIQAQ